MNVTTLIPAYKPHFLFDLLHALRFQTVKPRRVIISDDGPDLAFIRQLEDPTLKAAVADLHIETMVGPHTGGWTNFQHLLTQWNGDTELFHVLLDDDYLYPDFYERHLVAHASGDFNCSVSRRWTARETGQPLDDLPMPQAIAGHPNRMISLDPDVLFGHTVGLSRNWLGEFSNAVFRTDFRHELLEGRIAGISYRGLEDLGSFLKAGADKPLAFINERLGYFRQHANQNSAQPFGRPMKLGIVGYLALGIAAHRIGRLTDAQLSRQLAEAGTAILSYYHAQEDLAEICRTIPALAASEPGAQEAFLKAWETYVSLG